MSALQTLDAIEQLVENGAGLMGKRLVNELEFFTLVQKLRNELGASLDTGISPASSPFENQSALKPTRRVSDIIAEAESLSSQEQLQIVSALAGRLERKG